MTRRNFTRSAAALPLMAAMQAQQTAAPIGSRRELLIDRELIADMRGAELRLGVPVDAGPAIHFEKPWEGAFCGYTTILGERGNYRMYYRGVPVSGQDGHNGEVTCVAESTDGIHWSRPDVGIYEIQGTRKNNVILANEAPFSHNFSPMIDTRSGTNPSEKFKAVAGVHKTGLAGFVSADGLHWKKIQQEPVLPPQKAFSLDSQNVAFWSDAEKKYVLYYRTWKKIDKTNYRWVSRAVSDDFIHWTLQGEMDYGDAPAEHLYTNQTSMYFRAPHIYVGICARFMPGRQVVNDVQAKELKVDPKYFKDCSDAVLVTTRGGVHYTRTFMDAFLRPGVGLENWVSRSNYPALHVIQTSPTKMSFFVNRNYGQPTSYLRRYELRLDGFASAHAGYSGGEFTTKPLMLEGSRLELNYSTSAPGSIRVELQEPSGRPLPGFALADATELIGDEIERDYLWKSGADVSSLQGKPVRLRFVLKDADIFAFRFRS